MKRTPSLLLFFLVGVLHGLAADRAGTALAEIESLRTAKPPPELKGAALFHWSTHHRNDLIDRCERFLVEHPTDPRRWEAALVMFALPRIFITSTDDAKLDAQRPGTLVKGAVEYDREAQARWRQRLAALDAEGEAATDMTPEVRKSFILGRLLRRAIELGAAVTKREPVDLGAYRAEVNRAIALYPDEPQTAQGFDRYINLVRRQTGDPAAAIPLYEAYADSPSAGVRAIVQTGLMMKRAQEFPIDWKFTAADGREVDFTKLRGKVVLIDFWATWCKPCLEEIPSVLAAYRKYHDAGFEVVGISLENAGVPPGASPEVAEARLSTARRKLLEFTAKHDMPWPQYFDGTGWKNPYTAKYGIRGIPAMFLLDREGRVASLDARGKKLETELQRLLKP
jgi:thiol-disulfide isomerase/thioredoxin